MSAASPPGTSPLNLHPDAPDIDLVQGCLAGYQHAWTLLHGRHQPALLHFLTWRLRGQVGRICPDEVAGAVWVSLWRCDCRMLRRFDPARCPLMLFLKERARRRLRKLLERIEPVPLGELLFSLCDRNGGAFPLHILVDEVCPSLTRSEREFFLGYLLFPTLVEPPERLSEANIDKLTQRVQRKLAAHAHARAG